MTQAVNDRERECIQHALGLNRNRVPYRNYFSAEPGSPDDLIFVELTRRGLARLGRPARADVFPDNLWIVNDSGARAVGVLKPERSAA